MLLKTGKTLTVQATTKTSINRILKKTGRPQDAEDVVEECGAWGDVVTAGYDILKGKFVRTKLEPRNAGGGTEGERGNS